MNWDNIKIFVAVNRCGSIGKAAKQLQLNHSTVLRRLSALEKELNLTLFHRLSSGYEVTHAGEALLEQALRIENETIAFQRKAVSSEFNGSESLSIALPPAGSLDIMPLIATFKQCNPNIEPQLNFDVSPSNLNKLEAEVAIRYTNEPPENYVGIKVLNVKTRPYASQTYIESHAHIQSLEDIEDWIITSISGLTDNLEQWIAQECPNATISLRTNSTLMAAEAASYDMGITFLSENIAAKYPRLVPLPIAGVDNDMGLWILTHQDLRYQKRVKLFFEFMKEKLKLTYPQFSV